MAFNLRNLDKVYGPEALYHDVYAMDYFWEKRLPDDVHEYHKLHCEQFNSPVSLQMGLVLPFMASLLGPKTRARYFPTPTAVNLYWMTVAASGSGKTLARERLISDPLQYVMTNCGHEMVDYEVSKYTRAGIYYFSSLGPT